MRFPLWASVFTVLGISVLCALGFWQIGRQEWKRALLDNIAVEYGKDPMQVVLTLDDFQDGDILRRGVLVGRYLHDRSVLIVPRTHDGASGSHLVTPFDVDETYGGGMVLVNRGWLPVEYERGADFRISQPEGLIRLIGVFRAVPRGHMFTPNNNAAADAWYHIDPEEIGRAKGVKLRTGFLFYMEEELGVDKASGYPVPTGGRPELSNNHGQYAFFWFTLAGVLFVIYILRFVLYSQRAES